LAPGRYTVTSPLTVLFPENGRLAEREMPAGALIEIQTNPFHDGRLVSVKWGHDLVMVFDRDLKSRCKPIKSW
jgi:hypothetical protein